MPPRAGQTDGAGSGRGLLHSGHVTDGVLICGRFDVCEGRREKVSCSRSIRDVTDKNQPRGCFLISTHTIIAFNCLYYFFISGVRVAAICFSTSASPAKTNSTSQEARRRFAQLALRKMSFTRWEKQTSKRKRRKKKPLKRQHCLKRLLVEIVCGDLKYQILMDFFFVEGLLRSTQTPVDERPNCRKRHCSAA